MFKTREEAEKEYKRLGSRRFMNMIKKLAKPANRNTPILYHISDNPNLGYKWLKPKEPDFYEDYGDDYTNENAIQWSSELCPKRLSCSDTIFGCYAGLAARFFYKIGDEMKRKGTATLDCYLYQVILDNGILILDNKTITDYKLIHDSHITREYGIVSKFRLKPIEKLTFMFYDKLPEEQEVYYYPFDDTSRKLISMTHEMFIIDRQPF